MIYEDKSWLKNRPDQGGLRAKTVAGIDGSFSFDRHALGLEDEFILKVRDPRYSLRRLAVDVRDGRSGLTVTLSSGLTVRGTVRASDGTPLRNATVAVYEAWSGSPDIEGELEANAKTDAKGRFVVHHVNSGTRRLRVGLEGFATISRTITFDESKAAADEDLVLSPGGTISGRLSDAQTSTPIADALVAAFPLRPAAGETKPAGDRGPFLTTRSSPDGTYRLDGTDGAGYTVQVTAPGYLVHGREGLERPKAVVAVTPANGVDFALASGARAVGSVVDDLTGKPVSHFRAGLEGTPDGLFLPADHREFGIPESGAGLFEFLDVSPGRTFWVFATAPGYAGGRSREFVLGERERREGVEIRLVRGATVRGRVLTSEGKPLEDAIIEADTAAEPSNNNKRAMKEMTKSNAPRVRSDARGEFSIPALLSGSYKLSVSHPEFASHVCGPVAVPATGEVMVDDISLRWGVKIRGVVKLQDGRPDSRAMVSAKLLGSSPFDRRYGKTDAEGRYEVVGLPAGEYHVFIIQREGMSIMNPGGNRRFDSRSPENKMKVVTLAAREVGQVDF